MSSKKEEKTEKKIGNSARKRMEAQVFNNTNEIAKNILYIGHCGYCNEADDKKNLLFMYLKSQPENMCTYYCMNCEHKGTIKNIDKKDNFMFPMIDIVGEVARHYDPAVFDKEYNG